MLAATRGDSSVGEDVTANVRTIRDIPVIKGGPTSSKCGEVYVRADFAALNERQGVGRRSRQPAKCNSGSLRRGASVTAARPLRFLAHGWGEVSEPLAMMQLLAMKRIEGFGFPVSELLVRCETVDEALAHYSLIEQERADLPYDIDGVVYKVGRLDWQERLGQVGRAPRWGLAHKFPAEKAETTLEAIESRSAAGATPVGAKPVGVGGVIVRTSRSTTATRSPGWACASSIGCNPTRRRCHPQVVGIDPRREARALRLPRPLPGMPIRSGRGGGRGRRPLHRRADLPGAADRAAQALRVARGDGHRWPGRKKHCRVL